MDWAAGATELLWIGGLTAIPLALLVSLACRWPGCRPATRHAMWTAVLISFLTPALASLVWRPGWFESRRLLAAAEDGIARLRTEFNLDPEVTPPTPPSLAAAPAERPSYPARTTAPARESASPSTRIAREHRIPRPESRPDRSGPPASGASRAVGAAPPSMASHASTAGLPPEPLVAPGLVALDESPVAPRATDRSSPRSTTPSRPSENAPSRTSELKTSKERSGGGGRAAPSPAAASSLTPQIATEPEWANELRAWAAQAVNVRDSIAGLPPVPASIWVGGIFVLLVLGVARSVSFRRVLRHSRPASPETMELVRAAAAELGMRRAPVTLITGDRVSPMVWCGPQPKLVLPVGLWRELDAGSRRAVLLHELAHLKRLDHWLCWVATLVGVVYWWHPVAWWARKRIHDEADAACDAWVTSLMPASRRAYAEALVTTRWFLSSPGRRKPAGLAGAGALGVMSGKTKHLARRLKMVMTQRVAPRTSMVGALVALGVLATGMFVMPGLACPPEEAAQAKAKSELRAEMAVKAGKTPKAMKAEKAEKTTKGSANGERGNVEFFGEAPALEAMRRSGGAAKAGSTPRPDNEDQMLRRLEERMRRLEEQLQRLERSGGPRSANGQAPQAYTVYQTKPSAPGAAVGGMTLAAPSRPGAARSVTGLGVATSRPMAGMVSRVDPAQADNGADVAREYRLPDGKLQALTELMSRQDVPVLIEQHEDKIVVHAPESKQRVFAAFVKLIHPEAEVPVAAGQMGATTPRAVMIRREVQAQQQRELRNQMKQMEKQRRDAEKAAEKARERSETTQEQVEELQSRLEELQGQAGEDMKDSQKAKIEDAVARIMASIDAKSHDVAALAAEAEAKEAMLESLESAVEQLESTIDELDENMDSNTDDDAAIEIAPEEVSVFESMTQPAMPTPPIAPPAMAFPVGAAPTPALPPTPPAAPSALAPTPAPPTPAPPMPAPLPPSPPVGATPAPATPAAAPAPIPAPQPARA